MTFEFSSLNVLSFCSPFPLLLNVFQERDMLSQRVRTLEISVKELEQSLSNEMRNSHEYELRLKKAQNELENMREKYEKAVKDGQMEVLEERFPSFSIYHHSTFHNLLTHDLCYRRKMKLKMDALSTTIDLKKRDFREQQTIEQLQKELNIRATQFNRLTAQVKI